MTIQSKYEKKGPVPFSVAASLEKMNYWRPFIANRFRRFEHAFSIQHRRAVPLRRIYIVVARVFDRGKSCPSFLWMSTAVYSDFQPLAVPDSIARRSRSAEPSIIGQTTTVSLGQRDFIRNRLPVAFPRYL